MQLERALESAGVSRAQWSHPALQAAFPTELIHRRKTYPAVFRDHLSRACERPAGKGARNFHPSSDCLADELGINRHQARNATSGLAASGKFKRDYGTCSKRTHDREKKVISAE